MKEKLHTTYESMKPVNLIKSTYHEIAGSKDVQETVLDTTVGLAAGYATKAIIQGRSHNLLVKVASTAVQIAVTNAVRKHPEEIKMAARFLVAFLRPRHRVTVEKSQEANSREL